MGIGIAPPSQGSPGLGVLWSIGLSSRSPGTLVCQVLPAWAAAPHGVQHPKGVAWPHVADLTPLWDACGTLALPGPSGREFLAGGGNLGP